MEFQKLTGHCPSIIKTLSVAVAVGGVLTADLAVAESDHPTEHNGLTVEELAVVPAESMARQIDLEGHVLLARRITIEPGGQIAIHSHETIPGIVFMESGEWTEGRADGETVHVAGDAFIEDIETTHWFYNRSDSPATALVFDIRPPG